MLRRLLLGGRHRRGRFALERCDGFIPCPMSFPDEGPRHEITATADGARLRFVLDLSRLPAERKLRQILILGQEIIQAARRSAVALLRVCLESLSVYPIAFMMILGKDAAVGAPREFVPATADFSVQEPSLTQKAMFTNQALVGANRAIDARAFAPNRSH